MWRPISEAPQGVVLTTISENGIIEDLILKGNLWWLPDMSMYVYYTPIKFQVK